ncbi:MAG: MarR family transcriptional regulator [Candidatus Thorarchaeota archaeon]|nr:MAG: MarR family transcriptional regulator [Candidatus Thorarchaeota archaeon]
MVKHEEEIVEIFTKILEMMTFSVENLEFNGKQIGRSIFIINYVGKNEPCSLTNIYENTQFPASTASRRVDDLVKAGLIDRVQSTDDRRGIRVTLTEEGKLVHKLFKEHRIKSMKNFIKGFSEEEITIFSKVLHHLVENHEDIFVM